MEQHIAVSTRTGPRGLRPLNCMSAHYIGEEFPLVDEVRTGAGARPLGIRESHYFVKRPGLEGNHITSSGPNHTPTYQQLSNIAVTLPIRQVPVLKLGPQTVRPDSSRGFTQPCRQIPEY